MASNELQEQLQRGINAARSGNRSLGRRLLLQVTQEDPNNEQAWLWLASCVTTLRERRYCLERVLEINPDNEIAQRAMQQLDQPDAEEAPRRPSPTPRPAQQTTVTRRRRFNPATLIISGLLGLVLVGAGMLLLLSNEEPTVVTPLPTASPTADAVALLSTEETFTPTITSTFGPTNTPILVFNATSLAPTLPPTFTPTPETPTPTLEPTATPYPLGEMDAFAVSQRLGETESNLYAYNGDGTGENLVSNGVREVVYSPDGERVALIADVNGQPELFVAPVNQVDQAQRLTQFNTAIVASPSWSPDGQEIIFVSDNDGSEDLWLIPPAEPERLRNLTNSPDIIERDPAWVPRTDVRQVIFASDFGLFGETELFQMEIPRQGTEAQYSQLTDTTGASFDPTFSPDGRQIAFLSTRRGEADVFIASPDGSGAFLLTFDDGDAEDRNPSFTPDGQFIVFSSNRIDDRFQSFVVSPNGRVLTRITNNDRQDIQFVYRPIPGLISQ